MPRVQVSCPQCRQPITAEMEQLFDVGNDPQAKQRFLSGNVNTANCRNCGYRGPLSTPIVYHDPEKELLLTFFPPELGLPLNEQERLIEVEWGGGDDGHRYPVSVHIRAWDRGGLLRDIAAVVADEDINMRAANVVTKKQEKRANITAAPFTHLKPPTTTP